MPFNMNSHVRSVDWVKRVSPVFAFSIGLKHIDKVQFDMSNRCFNRINCFGFGPDVVVRVKEFVRG